ncbi:MAG: endonuclease/exonuclease/phosphatase family protein [Thermodesulfobacteriota bacterium]
MRLMTFNLRFENDRDGDNSWTRRKEMVVDVIQRYQPDILGTQEGKWSQIRYLCDHLVTYDAFLPGREPDDFIQCPTLFFQKAAIIPEGGKDFWLSKTPDVHLSKDWDSAFPRMLSHADILMPATGRRMTAAVTHLDHMGVEARYQQARIIADWVEQQPRPVILLGDFNDDPKSRVHAVLTVPRTRLLDTWQAAAGCDDGESFTHHGFTGKPGIARMDWILVDSSFAVRNARIIRDSRHGRYPSDHFPCLADIDGPPQVEE